jgi:hypothetical protein
MSRTAQTEMAVALLETFERAMWEPASPGPVDRITRQQWRNLQRQVLWAMEQDNKTGATR